MTTVVQRIGLALLVILALYGGFSAFSGGRVIYQDLAYLHRARLIDEYRQAQQAAKKAQAAQPAAPTEAK